MAKAAKKISVKKAPGKAAPATKNPAAKPTRATAAGKAGSAKPATRTAAKKTVSKPPAKEKTAASAKAAPKTSTKAAPTKPAASKATKKPAASTKATPKAAAKVTTRAAAKAKGPVKPTAPAKPAAGKATTAKPAQKAAASKAAASKSVGTKAKAMVTPPQQKKATTSAAVASAVAVPSKREPAISPVPAVRTRMINLDDVKLPAGYVPTADEEYMNPMQLLYFRNKLMQWRDELIAESQETLDHLRSEIRDVGDEAERASRESDNILELRTRDRYRKLLNKIDDAVKRIEDGSYGYCEETGEEIGLGRREARPIATLTGDAQERREMLQRQFRDDR